MGENTVLVRLSNGTTYMRRIGRPPPCEPGCTCQKHRLRYSDEVKQRAVRLSDQIGPTLAADRLGVPVRRLTEWRSRPELADAPQEPRQELCATPGCPRPSRPRRFCFDCSARLARIREELEREGDKMHMAWGNDIWTVHPLLLGIGREHLIPWLDPTFEAVDRNSLLAVAR